MEVSRFLPDDVLEQILVRLPVKHLLVLKCVCKHWNALIHDYAFINKHYHFQYAMHAALHHDIPLFLYYPYPGDDVFDITEFYLLSKKQGVDSVFNLTPHFERDALTSNFLAYQRLRHLTLHCTGVVNGVIGLQWGGRNSNRSNTVALVLALWNPATREFKDVPQWPVMLETFVISQILGLGFDVQSNDIKIMGLVTFIDNDVNRYCYKKECYLYSLKRNSWKKIKEHPSLNLDIEYSEADACLKNGVYYWLGHGSERHNEVIVSLNFSTESFRESDLELPECPECGSSQQMKDDSGQVCCCNSRYYSKTQIGKYKEGIAIYDIRTLVNKDSVIRIWVTTEFSDDGVPFSWQALLTVGPIRSYCGLWMLTYRLSGDLLLMIHRQNIQEVVVPGRWTLVSEVVEELGCLYDPCTGTLNFLEVGAGNSFSYVESLFSLSDKNN